jgi:hypothetical protein
VLLPPIVVVIASEAKQSRFGSFLKLAAVIAGRRGACHRAALRADPLAASRNDRGEFFSELLELFPFALNREFVMAGLVPAIHALSC